MLVCGIDEVGRGCLAGPVVAAAVILFPNSKHRLLKDSKALTKDELLKAYSWIIKNSWYSVSCVSHSDIDSFNIWQSTLMAMRQASLNLFYCGGLGSGGLRPKIILVDAMPLTLKNSIYSDIEVQCFIEGESHSTSIAAASIVAKVRRDALMGLYDDVLPGYNFSSHKGYSTKSHKECIMLGGHSIIHRLTYLKNIEKDKVLTDEKQESIFC